MTTLREPEFTNDPCGTCGECCRAYLVPVCGFDIWRISRSFHLYPNEFVVALPQQESTREGFILRPHGKSYGLALGKSGELKPGEPCIFLLEFAGEISRCSIFPQRPVTCRCYPMALEGNIAAIHEDALCPDGAWSQLELKRKHWLLHLQQRQMQFDIYGKVVAGWNGRINSKSSGTPRKLDAFFDYLLNVYDQIEAVDQELDKKLVRRIIRSWAELKNVPTEAELRANGLSACVEYRERVFNVITSVCSSSSIGD